MMISRDTDEVVKKLIFLNECPEEFRIEAIYVNIIRLAIAK